MLLLPMAMLGIAAAAADVLIGAPTILNNTGVSATGSSHVSDSLSPAQTDILFAIASSKHDTAVVLSEFSTTLANATITPVGADAAFGSSVGIGLKVSRITFSGPPGIGTITLQSDTTYQRGLIVAKVAAGFNAASPIGQVATNNKLSGGSLATTFAGAPSTTSLIMSAHAESLNDTGVTPPTGHTLAVDTAISTAMHRNLSHRLLGGTATVLTWTGLNSTQAAIVSWEVKD